MKRPLDEGDTFSLLLGLARGPIFQAYVAPHLEMPDILNLRRTSSQFRFSEEQLIAAAQRGLGGADLSVLEPANGVSRFQMCLTLWGQCHIDWKAELMDPRTQEHLYFNLIQRPQGSKSCFNSGSDRFNVFLNEESALNSDGFGFDDLVDNAMMVMGDWLWTCIDLNFTLPTGYRISFTIGSGGSGITLGKRDDERHSFVSLGHSDAHPEIPALRWQECRYISQFCDNPNVSSDLALLALAANCFPSQKNSAEYFAIMGDIFNRYHILSDAKKWRSNLYISDKEWKQDEGGHWRHDLCARRIGGDERLLKMCDEAFREIK